MPAFIIAKNTDKGNGVVGKAWDEKTAICFAQLDGFCQLLEKRVLLFVGLCYNVIYMSGAFSFWGLYKGLTKRRHCRAKGDREPAAGKWMKTGGEGLTALQQHAKKKALFERYFLKAFLIGLGLSFLVFIPFIIKDDGYFLFYGDFNVQQVPFYQIAHDAVRSGNLGWNHLTDLGANFIGSYSFYLLGSPFFWLTIPFPNDALPHLMGPLLMLKFACATLTGYVYLRRYVKNQNYAVIGGLLYAFSGFSIYNVFFNHFHEAIVFFPLMLAALDEYMYTRRRGIFALSVAACCIVNYYFFVGQVTFTLLYFFLRLLMKSWKISLRDLLLLGLEAVIGVGISGFILMPSVLCVLQNDRTNNVINGWNAVLYNKNQRYLHIIQSLFFPPDLPARPNFTPDSESKWASLGAWLPLFGMTGVIGWLQIRKKHWLKRFLWILFLMVMVPGLNASFQLFNGSFYGRWLYMLTLMMSLATVMALEYEPVNWKRAIQWSAGITCAIAGVIAFVPTITKDEEGGVESVTRGLMKYPTRFWSYVAIALICLALLVFLFQFCWKNRRRFIRNTTWLLAVVCVLYAVYFIALGKTQSLDPHDHIIPYALNGGKDITLGDFRKDGQRVDFYESLDNSAMYWKVESIQAFHSIVPGSIMDFYDTIGVQRDVASRPETEHYGLRGLTSVKWLFDDDHDDESFAGEEEGDGPKMPGWIYHGNENGFEIWENEYYVSMGFCYDYYVTEETLESTPEKNRELLMMKAVVLSDEQAERYNGLLQPLPEELNTYSETTYFQDCMNRSRTACNGFQYTQTGFAADINVTKETLVFFSVPFEDGWTAYVNGEPAQVERVNVGFMAVRVPQGEKVMIEFRYDTPGAKAGLLMTGAALLLLVGYLLLMRKVITEGREKRKQVSLLERGDFGTYAKGQGATFDRPQGMMPREFEQPDPPAGWQIPDETPPEEPAWEDDR